MADLITRSTYLEISSTPLATPAWRILDLSRLYGLVNRGQDTLFPTAAGVRANPRRVTMRTIGLPLLVEGHRDREGNAHADVHAGLDLNIDALIAAIVDQTAAQPAIWHRASGDVTADVVVEALEPQSFGRGNVRFTLDLSIPAGRFT